MSSKVAYDPKSGEISLFVMTNDDALMQQMLALNKPAGNAVIATPGAHSVEDVLVNVKSTKPMVVKKQMAA